MRGGATGDLHANAAAIYIQPAKHTQDELEHLPPPTTPRPHAPIQGGDALLRGVCGGHVAKPEAAGRKEGRGTCST